MLCPICAGEFQQDSDLCPACEFPMVACTMDERTARELAALETREVEFVELCRPRIHPVAMLIKQTLEQHGVTVLIQGGHSISVMPALAFNGQLRVMVASEQFEFASALYKAYFESDEEIDYLAEE
ncbi:MAG TPA: hypothetical protein VIG62_13665 [Blastocatellia bacterium]